MMPLSLAAAYSLVWVCCSCVNVTTLDKLILYSLYVTRWACNMGGGRWYEVDGTLVDRVCVRACVCACVCVRVCE